MTRIVLVCALAACAACKGGTQERAVEEPPPWEFPGEEVAPEDIPENVEVEMNQPSVEGTLTDAVATATAKASRARPTASPMIVSIDMRVSARAPAAYARESLS